VSILKRKGEILAREKEEQIDEYRKQLGEEYVFDQDEALNVLLVSKLDAGRRKRYLASLKRHAEALWKDFFPCKPKRLISVFVLKDLTDYVAKFGGDKANAGWYDEKNRRLVVNLATGSGTMIHEWTHALHYVDMEALSQKHPMWIIEGFGSLYEHSEDGPEGSVRGRLNWRLTGLTEVMTKRRKAYIPWRRLMATSTDLFYKPMTLGTAYAMARYIFYYLQQEGKLSEFYRKYREDFAKDATGAKALEAVFGKKISKIEAEWKRWILKRRYFWGGMIALRGKVDLGVSLAEDERGVTVADFELGSVAGSAGIRRDDVIVAVDGDEVKKAADLIERIAKKEPGNKVKIKVRRGETEHELVVTLVARKK
jgi:hypothetical protein